jgi:DNA-binding response OmpR family regulator
MDSDLLLVEDERHLADTIAFNLEAEGYQVRVAPTIAAARAALQVRTPDLIILDAMLPDGDGFRLCTDLRAAGDHTPVLMLTARSSRDDIVEGLSSGADDYLAKPFDLDELLGRIAAQLRRRRWSQRSASEHVCLGPHRVDLRTGIVTVEGQQSTRLGDMEIRLLRYLANNPGQDLDRTRILAAVWNLPPDRARSRTLDTHIARLRKRLEADPANPRHLLTVHGVGYRLEI